MIIRTDMIEVPLDCTAILQGGGVLLLQASRHPILRIRGIIAVFVATFGIAGIEHRHVPATLARACSRFINASFEYSARR
ncbi:hypothetical protein BTW08_06350 [Salinicola sp. MH3R3-1]|nr:hypothetical protein BTW08_06350 [Salinicola sp. MH3R3-1]